MLEGTFPLHPMRQYSPAILFKGHQMRNFVDERDQKSVLVQRCVHRDHVKPIGQPTVVTLAGDPVIHDLEVHPMGLDELKTWRYGPFRQVFFECGVHWSKDTF